VRVKPNSSSLQVCDQVSDQVCDLDGAMECDLYYEITCLTLIQHCITNMHTRLLKAKFHYAIQLASRSQTSSRTS